jgi:hypothetical protein
LPTTNPTTAHYGANPGFRSKRPAAKRPRYCTPFLTNVDIMKKLHGVPAQKTTVKFICYLGMIGSSKTKI